MSDIEFNNTLEKLIEICSQNLANDQSIQGITYPYCGAELSKLFDDDYYIQDEDTTCLCCGLDDN